MIVNVIDDLVTLVHYSNLIIQYGSTNVAVAVDDIKFHCGQGPQPRL